MTNKETLILGQGIGPAKFGITEQELISAFGEPDNRESDIEDGEEIHSLDYDNIFATFCFEKFDTDDFLLSTIIVENPEISIENKFTIGDNEETVRKAMKTFKCEEPELEKEDEGRFNLYYEDVSLVLFFENNTLVSISASFFIDEDDNINWPE